MTGNSSKPSNSRLCLLVDDSTIARRIAAEMFRTFGYNVVEASSGRRALEVCSESVPDVVLLDWNMPVMDGVTCLANLRAMKLARQPKVILCTTESALEKIRIAIAAGADEYIMKPFDREILRDKLIHLGLKDPVEEAT